MSRMWSWTNEAWQTLINGHTHSFQQIYALSIVVLLSATSKQTRTSGCNNLCRVSRTNQNAMCEIPLIQWDAARCHQLYLQCNQALPYMFHRQPECCSTCTLLQIDYATGRYTFQQGLHHWIAQAVRAMNFLHAPNCRQSWLNHVKHPNTTLKKKHKWQPFPLSSFTKHIKHISIGIAWISNIQTLHWR